MDLPLSPDMAKSDSEMSRWSAESASDVSFFTRVTGGSPAPTPMGSSLRTLSSEKDGSSFHDGKLVSLMARISGPEEEIDVESPPPALPFSHAPTAPAHASQAPMSSKTTATETPTLTPALATEAARSPPSPITTSRPLSDVSAHQGDSASTDLDSLTNTLRQLLTISPTPRQQVSSEGGGGVEGGRGSGSVTGDRETRQDPNIVIPQQVAAEVLAQLECSKARAEQHSKLQSKFAKIRRASRAAAQGFSLARTEFDAEVNARHRAEAQLTALRASVHSTLPSPIDPDENEIRQSIRGIEADRARLAAQRELERSELAELVRANQAALRTSVALTSRARSLDLSSAIPSPIDPQVVSASASSSEIGKSAKSVHPPPRRKHTRAGLPSSPLSTGGGLRVTTAVTPPTTASDDTPLTGLGAIGMALVQPVSGASSTEMPGKFMANYKQARNAGNVSEQHQGKDGTDNNKDEGIDALTAARSLPVSPDKDTVHSALAPPGAGEEEKEDQVQMAARIDVEAKATEDDWIEEQATFLSARLVARLDEVKASHRTVMDELVTEQNTLESQVVSLRDHVGLLSRDVEQLVTLKDCLQEETLALTRKNEELSDAVAQQARQIQESSRLLDQYEAQFAQHYQTGSGPGAGPGAGAGRSDPPPPAAAASSSPSRGSAAAPPSTILNGGPPRSGLLQRFNGSGLPQSASSGSLYSSFGFGRSPTPQHSFLIPPPEPTERASSPSLHTTGTGMVASASSVAGSGPGSGPGTFHTSAPMESPSAWAPVPSPPPPMAPVLGPAPVPVPVPAPPPPPSKKFRWGKSRPAGQSIGTAMISAPLVAAGGAAQAFSKRPPTSSSATSLTTSSTTTGHQHSPSVQSGTPSVNLLETSSMASSGGQEHTLVPFNVLRPVRCMACGKNMWGASEARCMACGGVVHLRCKDMLTPSCSGERKGWNGGGTGRPATLGSMFGSDLVDQCTLEGRPVPLIVEKCIEAVEMNGTYFLLNRRFLPFSFSFFVLVSS